MQCVLVYPIFYLDNVTYAMCLCVSNTLHWLGIQVPVPCVLAYPIFYLYKVCNVSLWIQYFTLTRYQYSIQCVLVYPIFFLHWQGTICIVCPIFYLGKVYYVSLCIQYFTVTRYRMQCDLVYAIVYLYKVCYLCSCVNIFLPWQGMQCVLVSSSLEDESNSSFFHLDSFHCKKEKHNNFN
jgi:hypothetical protein